MHALAKIIAAHAGRESVEVAEIVNVAPDYIMLNDRGAGLGAVEGGGVRSRTDRCRFRPPLSGNPGATMEFDVVIMGAGPAGLATAIARGGGRPALVQRTP
jgi:hypothetical protein